MGFGSKILPIILIITFLLISLFFTHILIANTTLNVNEMYSVQKEEQNVLVLEKFRSLLGQINFRATRSSVTTAPAPSPSPSHLAPFDRKHSHLPLHNHHHIFPPTQSRKQKAGNNNNTRRIVTAVLVSAGAGSLLCAFGLFWGCKKFVKKRMKATSSVSIFSTETGNGGSSMQAMNKVSSNPAAPDLFYLDSLAAALDPQPFSIKQNQILANAKSDDEVNSLNGREESQELEPDHDNNDECYDVREIIMPAHEEAESSQLGANVCNKLCDYVMVSEEEEEAHSSDDESFYSVCNSQSSPKRLLTLTSATSFGEYSQPTSPKASDSSLVSSPAHFTTQTTALKVICSQGPPPPPPPPPPIFSQSRSFPLSQTNSLSKRVAIHVLSSSASENVSSSSSNANPCEASNIACLIPPQGIPLPPFPPPNSLKSPSQHFQYSPLGKDGVKLPRLKPLHWDKVRTAPDRSTVWDKLKSSSFEFDEEMIESMFGYDLQNSMKKDEFRTKTPSPTKHVLEPKRLQNITILSKALNGTPEQVCNALVKGSGLSLQELEALGKMILTKEEEDKLSNYEGSINELGSAEKFVKAMLNIPFAFSRVEAMLYKETFDDELMHLRKSFFVLEEACKELRSSRLFLKLLEAVLKTGNRMNVGTIRGGAKAFKLDALLKLADVKGTDGKTTLLHFVVQEIIRSEGFRASDSIMGKISQRSTKGSNQEQKEEDYRRFGLDLVSGLTTELCNVKKTATLDLDVLANSVSNLSDGMIKLKHLVDNLSSGEQDKFFVSSMKTFLNYSDKSLAELQDHENRVLLHVREITEYFHGDVGKDECNPLRIFVIVRDFLGLLDQVCKELRSSKTPSTSPNNNPLAPFC